MTTDENLATAHKYYGDARYTADKLDQVNEDRIYNVRRRPDGYFIIEVRENDSGDELFLGYL